MALLEIPLTHSRHAAALRRAVLTAMPARRRA